MEHAIRMARLHTGRPKVLSAYRSYHGGTQQAVNLTGDPRRWASDTGTAGVVRFWAPFLYRSRFYAETEEQECARALEHLETTIAFEGPGTVAAIILETIPGTAGIMPPPPATSRACASCATSTASSSSWTRSWPASGGPAPGSRRTCTTSSRT
ncbi:hypothetical protein SHKM778_02640 [Streptomyces sp. KM77-8]|uniref:Aminotransferase class III-fold pyridoxal phosphate-dependent enzyme n=1 Tax=Streptomyces haneummycinicus TaxID=3074435 RepID=A0AAT9H933_9ACTN